MKRGTMLDSLDRMIAQANERAKRGKTYTVEVRNELLGNARFSGTWGENELEAARDYARRHASRKFVETVIWTGTPRDPINPIGESFRGKD